MDQMEFWGIEVKGKDATKVKVEDHLLHLSQATLGEVKKDGEPVTLYVKVGEKKLALGVLNPKTNPQLSFDLVFEKDFEISHNWKNGSVHLMGYQSELGDDDEEIPEFSSDEDEDEELPVPTKANGDVTVKVAAPKANAGKPKKDNKQKADAKVEKDEDSDDDEDIDDEMADLSNDSDDGSDDDEESSEEETPVKADAGKKRKPEIKTPEPKKAKVVATPKKTDGKKGAPHTATPHPAKKGGKTSPSAEKSTPKSGAQISCGTCKKTFNSEVGLQSHTKAKHSGGK